MARKTKQEAEATRCGILDAAERLFQAQGVSRTTLQHIAEAAGVTRGAIYWHFADKGDLFNAMMDRLVLPMEAADARLDADTDEPVLPALRERVGELFAQAVRDPGVQRVLEIVIHKVEYVDELAAVRERRLQLRHAYRLRLERLLRRGQRRGEVITTVSARQLAVGLHALIDGLLHNWLLDPGHFDLRTIGLRVLDVQLAGMAAPLQNAAAGDASARR